MKLNEHLDNILTKIFGYITIADVAIHVVFLKIYRFLRATILDIFLLTFRDGGHQNKCSHIIRTTLPRAVFLVSINRFFYFKIDYF